MHAEEKYHIEECDNIDIDFPEFKNFKCVTILFCIQVNVDEEVEICGRVSYDDIIKTTQEDEKEETVHDSEENGETFKCLNG